MTPIPRPERCVITGVKGWARETRRRENPRARFSPGVPELSLILGSRPYGGVSGGWGAIRPAHERQQHLCRGMGVPYGSPNNNNARTGGIVIFHCALEQRDLYFGIGQIDTAPSNR